jgi:hypothetical protein
MPVKSKRAYARVKKTGLKNENTKRPAAAKPA